MAGDIISCDQFPQFLVDQTPVFDELIMEDIRPTDGWLLNIQTGSMPTGTPTEVTQDRFKHVFPNTTKTWTRTNVGSCIGTPCDKVEYCIGWGAERKTYYAEEQSWQTPLLCYDQDMHITHAMEHIAQIIRDILRPATTAISSNFMRKRAAQWAGKRWVASKYMPSFNYSWTVIGDEEIYIDMNVSPDAVFKLTPQMLQRRFEPLMRLGYGGKNPFKETAPFIELVTDIATCWDLDKLGGSQGVGGTPSTASNWRFTQWSAANEYWRYGFSGQLGNYMVRTDPMGLRFNYVTRLANGLYRYQVVLPYVNVVTSGAGGAAGIGSEENPDFDDAQFSFSFIWHKSGMELLVMNATPLNSETPFGARDFGGKWQFVMDNLGTDVNGCVIENKRRNKGQFIADYKYYLRPMHVEFVELIFHKREPACVIEINTCNRDPGYPAQVYNSCNTACVVDSLGD
jgi:hypothetical protein